MFKVESYLGPLLLGYLNKYVKLKQQDFQLSLWGGDAVFYNLELQYNFLENLIPFPIRFKSGQVHELRIHVPWTKLGSESLVITLNTVECILSRKDSSMNPNASSDNETSNTDNSDLISNSETAGSTVDSSISRRSKKYGSNEADVPPGYLQSFMNRIVNNIHIIANNLILKFVEDDIVVSMNVKSGECFSTTSEWQRSFVEVTPPDLLLHKVITLTDMTVCLDRMNAAGHIDVYEEPCLYRCGLECRVQFRYHQMHSMVPVFTRLHVRCDQLDISLTDTQLPMFYRLIELAMALYYGEFQNSSATCGEVSNIDDAEKRMTSDVGQLQDLRLERDIISGSPSKGPQDHKEDTTQDSRQSWGSWAWSYVPTLLYDEVLEEEDQDFTSVKLPPFVFMFGMFIGKAQILFKQTLTYGDTRSCYSKRIQCVPMLKLDLEGVATDVRLRGITFSTAQFAITKADLFAVGNVCTCGFTSGNESEHDHLVSMGVTQDSNNEVNFLSESLFSDSPQSQLVLEEESWCSRESYLATYNETQIFQRAPAFWYDYMYSLEIVKERLTEEELDVTRLQDMDGIRERSLCRIFAGRCEVVLNSNFLHRAQRLLTCITTSQYEPYSKVKPEKVNPNRPLPTEEQVARFHEHLPTRVVLVVVKRPRIKIHPLGHKNSIMVLLQGQCERVELHTEIAMYPRFLVRLVSRMVSPPERFLECCYQRIGLHLTGMCAALCFQHTLLSPLLSPMEAIFRYRRLLLPMYWSNAFLAKEETVLELPQIAISINPAQVFLVALMTDSWIRLSPCNRFQLPRSFISNAQHSSELPILDLSIVTFHVRRIQNQSSDAFEFNLHQLQAALLRNGSNDLVPALDMRSADAGKSAVQILAQFPADLDIICAPFFCHVSFAPLSLVVTPMLQQWFSYTFKVNIVQQRSDKEDSHTSHRASATRDVRLAPLIGGLTSTHSAQSTPQPANPPLMGNIVSMDSTNGRQVLWWKLKRWLQGYYKHIQRIDLQMNISPWRFYLLLKDFNCSEMPVSEGLDKLIANRTPAGFLIQSPSFLLLNHSVREWSPTRQVPLRSLPSAVTSEHLPWRISTTGLTIQNLKSSSVILPPVDLSATLAATAKYQSALTDTLSSLAWCLHLDMSPCLLNLTHPELVEVVPMIGSLMRSTSLFVGQWTAFLRLCALPRLVRSKDAATADASISRVSSRGQRRSRHGTKPEMELVSSARSSDDRSLSSAGFRDISTPIPGSAVSPGPKLSLWLQWTLVRSSASFAVGGEGSNSDERLKLQLGECTISFDIQEQFSQVKMKIGHAVCRTRRAGGDRSLVFGSEGKYIRPVQVPLSPGDDGACSQQSRHVFNEIMPNTEQNRRFLTIVLTRASARDVRKKFKKMRGDLDHSVESGGSGRRHQFPQAAYLNEISAALEPTDIVLSPQLLRELQAFARLIASCWPIGDTDGDAGDAEPSISTSTHTHEEPWLIVSKCPLVYLDLKSIRIFISTNTASISSVPENQSSNTIDDTLLVTLNTLTVTPYSDNPLERLSVNMELYDQVKESDCLGHLGSAVEDRQYQMEIRGLNICSGRWQSLVRPSSPVELKGSKNETTLTSKVQVPAVEWNRRSHDAMNGGVSMHPILTNLDLKICFAPAIYSSHSSSLMDHLICGYSAEVNVISDMYWLVSLTQLNLLCDLMRSLHAAHPCSSKDSGYETGSVLSRPQSPVSVIGNGSGSFSVASLLGEHFSPFSVLLTARGISLAITERGDVGHKVGLQLRVDLPYTMVRVETSRQRLILSCFDILLRLPCGVVDEMDEETLLALLAKPSESPTWLRSCFFSRPGQPSPKTGVAPSLYTVECTDFLEKPGALRISVERPLQLCLDLTAMDQLKNLTNELIRMTSKQEKSEAIGKDDESNFLIALIHSVEIGVGDVEVTLTDSSLPQPHPNIEIQFGGAEAHLVFDNRYPGEWLHTDTRAKLHLLSIRDTVSPSLAPSSMILAPWSAEIHIEAERFGCNSKHERWKIQMWAEASDFQVRISSLSLRRMNLLTQQSRQLLINPDVEQPQPSVASRICKDIDSTPLQFCDDLRSNAEFIYVDTKNECTIPAPREIVFLDDGSLIAESDQNGWQEAIDAACGMTWRYPQPRRITHLEVTPVPFVFVEVTSARRRPQTSLRLPCHLQVWRSNGSTPVGRFQTVMQFHLSESEHLVVQLPQSLNQETACVWRVLVERHAREYNVDGIEDQSAEMCFVHVSPKSLAACLRVDSLYQPSVIPYLDIHWHSFRFQLHVFNRPELFSDSEWSKLNHLLSPHRLTTEKLPVEEELLRLQLHSCDGQVTLSDRNTLRIATSLLTEIGVVDTRFAYSEILSPSTRWSIEASSEVVNDHITGNILCSADSPVECRVTPNCIHALGHLYTCFGETTKCVGLGSRLFVCNQTGRTLLLQQIGCTQSNPTRLEPGCALPWCWSRGGGIGWRVGVILNDGQTVLWSPEVDAPDSQRCHNSSDGVEMKALVWDSPRGCIRLCVSARALNSGIVQFTFTADLVFCNLLPHCAALQLVTSPKIVSPPSPTVPLCKEEADEDIAVEAEASASYSPVSHMKDAKGIRLRIGKWPWSTVVELGHETVQVVKLQMTSSAYIDACAHIHAWCHIFVYTIDNEEFYGVVVSPLFALHNALPSSLTLGVTFPRLGKEERLIFGPNASSLCKEHDLLNRELEIVLTARYGSSPSFEPAISLSSERVVRDLPKRDEPPGFESLFRLSSFSKDDSRNAKTDDEDKMRNTWNTLSQGSLVCANLTRVWSSLNTVQIRFVPWLIVSNETEADLLLKFGETSCVLRREDVLVPPDCKDLIRIGIERGGQNHWSSPLVLVTDDRNALPNHRMTNSFLCPGFPPLSISIRTQDAVVSLSTVLVVRNQSPHLSIKSRYIIHNGTKHRIRLRSIIFDTRTEPGKRASISPNSISSNADIVIDTNSESSHDIIEWKELTKQKDSIPDKPFLLAAIERDTELTDNLWSNPVPLDIGTNTESRMYISIPMPEECDMYACLPTSVSIMVSDSRIWMRINVDPSPELLIHNMTPWNLLVKSNQEEHKVYFTPHISSGSSLSYTIPRSDPIIIPDTVHLQFAVADKEEEWSDTLILPGITRNRSGVAVAVTRLSSDCWITARWRSGGQKLELRRAEPKVDFIAASVRSRLELEEEKGSVTMEATEPENENDSKRDPHWRLNINLPGLSFLLMEETQSGQCRPFLSVHMEGIEVNASHQPIVLPSDFVVIHDDEGKDEENIRIQLTVEGLQIDNCAHERRLYDFPVILSGKESPVLQCHIHLRPKNPSGMDVTLLDIKPGSCVVHLEDRFIYDLLWLLGSCLSMLGPDTEEEKCKQQSLSEYAPVFIDHFHIGVLDIQLSFRASLKLFLSVESTPLRFREFSRHRVRSDLTCLTRALAYHYVTDALYRAGLVVGSLELLGNPTGLIRSAYLGVVDLLHLPYAGMSRGPGGLVLGVSNGVSSLLRHLASGLLGSVTSLASSVQRNLDYLSLDEAHLRRQEAFRHSPPEGIVSAMHQGLTGLGWSLLGAIAGMADQPLQALVSDDGSLSKMRLVAMGLGRGLIGAVAKPLSGAAGFLAHTGTGLMIGTGLSVAPSVRSSLHSSTSTKLHAAESNIYELLCSLCHPDDTLLWLSPTYRLDEESGRAGTVLLLLTSSFLVEWSPNPQIAPLLLPLTNCRLETSPIGSDCIVVISSIPESQGTTEKTDGYIDLRIEEFIQGISCADSESTNSSLLSPAVFLYGPEDTNGPTYRLSSRREVEVLLHICQ